MTYLSHPILNWEDLDDYPDHVWRHVERFALERPGWWPTYHGAINLYREGQFGRVCHELESMADAPRLQELISGDCNRCGKADTGGVRPEYHGMYYTPDGESHGITNRSVFCDDCIEAIINDIETYGEPQPKVTSF